ncbi:hypothetical protein Tco_0693323 [Tanacetum coccineum]
MESDSNSIRFREPNGLLKQVRIDDDDVVGFLAWIQAPAFRFRERLKADNVFPSESLAAQLAQVNAFKKTATSDVLD